MTDTIAPMVATTRMMEIQKVHTTASMSSAYRPSSAPGARGERSELDSGVASTDLMVITNAAILVSFSDD